MDELAGLDHSAARRVIDSTTVRTRVCVVVVYDGNDRQFQARHIPERGWPEEERTVTYQTDYLLVGSGEFDTSGRSHTGTEMRPVIKEKLAASDGVEVETVKSDGTCLMDDDGILICELGHLVSQSVSQQRACIPIRISADLRPQDSGLFGKLACLFSLLLSFRLEGRRHAGFYRCGQVF